MNHILVLIQDPRELLESGEQTIFPALHVGEEKQSAVVSKILSIRQLMWPCSLNNNWFLKSTGSTGTSWSFDNDKCN